MTLPPTQEEQRHVREYVFNNLKNFRDRVPYFTWDERHVNLNNFEDALTTFGQLAVEEEGSDITVLLGAPGVPGAAAAVAVTLLGMRGAFPSSGEVEGASVFPRWLRAGKVLDDHEVRVLGELLEAPLDKIGLIQRLQQKGVIRDDIGKHAYARVNSFLSGLVKRGFVEVVQGPDYDRRRQAIVLTEAGRQAHRILSLNLKPQRTTLHVRAGKATSPSPAPDAPPTT